MLCGFDEWGRRRGPAVVEETLEAEEALFVEVEGEVGRGEAEKEDQQAGEEDDGTFIRGEVKLNQGADGLFQISEEDDVQDVDAIAVFAEPTHGPDGEEAADEAGAQGDDDETAGVGVGMILGSQYSTVDG